MANENYTKVNVQQLSDLASTIQRSKSEIESGLTNYKNLLQSIQSSGYLEGVSTEAVNQSYNKIINTYEKFAEYATAVVNQLNGITEETQSIEQTQASAWEEIIGADPLNFGAAAGAIGAAAGAVGAAAGAVGSEETSVKENNPDSGVAGATANVGKSMNVPSGSTNFKSYTNYKALTEKKNAEGEYVYKGSAIAYGGTATDGTTYNTYTDQETGVRCVDIDGEKYYCAAMGTYYGEPGDTFKVTTDEGNSYNVIMCDNKGGDAQGKITVNGTTYTQYHGTDNKCLTEFYIDKSAMPEDMKVYRNGEYIGTTGTYNSIPQFKGNVVSIEKY